MMVLNSQAGNKLALNLNHGYFTFILTKMSIILQKMQ